MDIEEGLIYCPLRTASVMTGCPLFLSHTSMRRPCGSAGMRDVISFQSWRPKWETGLSDELAKSSGSVLRKIRINGGNKNGSEEKIISRHRTLGRA